MRPLLWLLTAAALAGDFDPRQIVRRSVSVDNDNWKRARNYTFLERSETRELDSHGAVKSRKSRTYDVTLLEGSSYRRLIERDDQPLPPKDEAKEEERLRKSIDERRRETEAQRRKRLAEFEKQRDRNRALVQEVADAFDFKLLGEESISGRPAYVLEAAPRPGYRPRDSRARIFPKVKGKLWIDKADYYWVRIAAEVIDTISFGWFLARLAKGGRIEVEQTRVNDEVWLPQRMHVVASARLGLVKKFNIDQEMTFRNYSKFQTDARIISTEEVRQ